MAAVAVATASLTVSGCGTDGGPAPAPATVTVTATPAAQSDADSSPTTAAETKVVAARLADVDWSSATVPARCSGEDEVVTLTDYTAPASAVPGATFELDRKRLLNDTVGGLDGHPRIPVNVVTVRCIGASASPDAVLVYADDDTGAALVGYALTTAEGERVYDLAVDESGRLEVTTLAYTPGAPQCCPDIIRWRTFTVDPDKFELTLESVDSEPYEDSSTDVVSAECATLPALIAEEARLKAAARAETQARTYAQIASGDHGDSIRYGAQAGLLWQRITVLKGRCP
jgi:hypothetical protein